MFSYNKDKCIGSSSCDIELKSITDNGKYVFVKARCKNTEVFLGIGEDGGNVKKTYIILIVAALDFIAIIIFAIGIAL
jgi:hypothetical protein